MLEAVKIALQFLERVELKGTEAQAFVYTQSSFKKYIEDNSPDAEVGDIPDAND